MPETEGRGCAFCGRIGVKLTREHVFPNWINNVLRLTEIEAMHVGQDGERRNWKMNALEQKVKVVCTECNSGWMSRELEAPVKPLLIPMILGQAQHANLGAERQTLIAAWALKTALMIEQIFPGSQSFPPSDYAHLYEQQRPTTGTVVLLSMHRPPIGEQGVLVATSKGASLLSVLRDKAGRPIRDAPEGFRTGVVMFAVQHLIFTVFSHNLPAELDIDVRPPGPGIRFEDYYQQAWPIVHRRLKWPLFDLNEVGGFDKSFDAWRGST